MTLVRCCTGRLAKVARCIGDRVSRLSDPSEWLRFAQADLAASRLLLTDAELPFRLACFHAQQAAEKALKAALVQGSVEFRKSHDLVVLAGLQTDHSDRRSASLTSNCSSSGLSMALSGGSAGHHIDRCGFRSCDWRTPRRCLAVLADSGVGVHWSAAAGMDLEVQVVCVRLAGLADIADDLAS